MIEFVEGPHGEGKPSKMDQAMLAAALENCTDPNSFYCWLNMIYNNSQHFNNTMYAYHTWSFLQDISKIAKSKNGIIRVMGTVHQDPGHTSGVVLHQYNDYYPPYGCFVSDSYIRFSLHMKETYKLNVLDEYHVYHFLTEVPDLLWTQNQQGSIIVASIPYDMDCNVALDYYPSLGSGVSHHLQKRLIHCK